MKLTFLGCGSAFTTPEYYQSNVLIQKNGKNFLIDCGSDIRFSLAPYLKPTDIDAVFITHLHADHVGGMEWLAFCNYFTPTALKPPTLYGVGSLLPDLWSKSLSGGLESVQGRVNTLDSYFECVAVYPNHPFIWENIEFQPVQTCHVMNGFKLVESYGLLIKDLDLSTNPSQITIFYTGDTQFAPNQLKDFYDMADVIFHDCETTLFQSGVHAHYDQLLTLPLETRSNMWLYHYQPNPTQDARDDGFQDFVTKGQIFEFGE